MSDASFHAIRDFCLARPGAEEVYQWGCVVWKVGGKVFAIGVQDEPHVTLKSTPERQEVLVNDPAISVASHVGRFGWISVAVSDEETLNMALDLTEQSYEMIVAKMPKRARSELGG